MCRSSSELNYEFLRMTGYSREDVVSGKLRGGRQQAQLELFAATGRKDLDDVIVGIVELLTPCRIIVRGRNAQVANASRAGNDP
jgi:hypothetical protein